MDDLEIKRLSYVRVSEVIGKQTERQMRSIPIEALANASLRGTAIHQYCTAHLKNLFIPQYEAEYENYLEEFIRWCDENVEHLLFSEIRLYDDELKISGQFDAIVRLKGSKKTALIDIKTSATSSLSWPVQLAAYKHLCELNGYNVDYVFNLHLKKIKPARFEMIKEQKVMVFPPIVKAIKIEHEDLTPYWEIFTSALKCYNYFENKEVNHDIL